MELGGLDVEHTKSCYHLHCVCGSAINLIFSRCRCQSQCEKNKFVPALYTQAIDERGFCGKASNRERALDPQRSPEDSYALRARLFLEERMRQAAYHCLFIKTCVLL